jgi:hypothetical protein
MASFSQDEVSVTFEDIDKLLTAQIGQIDGTDTDEGEYTSVKELWQRSLSTSAKSSKVGEENWYSDAYEYWENEANCPLSDDGVLGGYGKVTHMDVKDSNLFLDNLLLIRPQLQFDKVADCGAGIGKVAKHLYIKSLIYLILYKFNLLYIGRVAKHLLLDRFKYVDLIEQSPRLLEASPEYIGERFKDRVECVVIGLQDFAPEPNSYDTIWIQWVIDRIHQSIYL